MSELQTAETNVEKVLTDADVNLDAAALAADNIAGTTKLQDAEAAAQKIQSLELSVKDLQQTISDMGPVFTAAKAFMDSSPEILKLKDDIESALSNFEADLPESWRTRLSALLVHSRQYMGL